MLLVICSAVTALACRDIERPAEKPGGTNPVAEQAGPPVISSLTCTFTRSATTVTCSPAVPPAGSGVSASVIYGTGAPGTALYGIFWPINLVKDTVAHQWSFTAYVQNLLKQSIGTLNGTTVTGVKVFVTDFHATAGTGSVSIANADGTANFTAPNQPYFNYNQIVAAGANSGNKLWKFNVPNTVTAVSMSILISTDFPAEQSVTIAPPSTVPDWVHADSSVSAPTDSVHLPFVKRVLQVRFRASATLADRQLAVASVNGAVLGGRLDGGGVNGIYYVQVPDDGTGSGLIDASTALRALPQVQMAFPEFLADGTWLKPLDSGDWATWTLSPDTVNTSKKNWASEMVNAPMAWGCNTGGASVSVGIVDHGFRRPADLVPNLPATSYAFNPPGSDDHATMVASIIAARGSLTGTPSVMTGMMWNASLKIEDAAVNTIAPFKKLQPTADRVALRVAHLAQMGVRIVNISEGARWSVG